MRERKLPRMAYDVLGSEESYGWTSFDRAISEAIYRQHAPFAAGFLSRIGVAARHVDDEVGRVFSEVHGRSACAPGNASSKAWVAALALHGASRRHPIGKVELAACAPNDGAAEPTMAEFLQSLEPELRAIFILFELEAEPCDSIAAAFGLTIECVHERVREGQHEFRRAHGLLDAAAAPSVEDDDHALPAFVDPVPLV